MEREDIKRGADKEQIKENISDIQNKSDSSAKPSDVKNDDVVKEENIPVVYIDTRPDVLRK